MGDIACGDWPANVEMLDTGHVAIWTGAPDDPVGFGLTPVAALATARRVLDAIGFGDDAPPDVVLAVRLEPGSMPGAPSMLTIVTSAGERSLLIAPGDLAALAETANAALMASRSAGVG